MDFVPPIAGFSRTTCTTSLSDGVREEHRNTASELRNVLATRRAQSVTGKRYSSETLGRHMDVRTTGQEQGKMIVPSRRSSDII